MADELKPVGLRESGNATTDIRPIPRTNPCLWGILAVFCIAGFVRAVPFHVLTPDSGDFLIAARSLVTGNGYRDLSSAGAPPFTWRPPGLAVLLMPAAALNADCSTYAKTLMVLYALVMLWCLYCYAYRIIGPDWGLFPVLLLAASPQMLVYATEVLSEVPFTAVLLGLLCLAHDWETGRRSVWRLIATAVLLIALPMLRTVGAPLVGVWILWSLTSRRRWILLLPSLCAVGALISWSAYIRVAGGARYDSLIAVVLESEGLFKFLLAGIVNLLTYMKELNHELFPGVLTNAYVELVSDTLLPPLFGKHSNTVLALAGTIVLAGGAASLLWRQRAARGLTALTIGTYVATVCLYPLRSERLLWPLTPVIWTLFIGGITATLARALQSPTVPRKPALIAGGALLLLAATELRDWPGMLRPAWGYWTARERFYATTEHPGYFSDWRSAASFLHERSRPGDAVMAMVKEFYTVSERNQVRLEIGCSPAEMAEIIAANRVRWIVIGYGYSRRAMNRMLWHPRYSFALRYPKQSEYEIYEVLPNREGVIPATMVQLGEPPKESPDYTLWDRARLAFLRRDFAACAKHLRALHEIPYSNTLASHLLLARAEARLGEYDNARLCYRRMRLMESNESFAREIVDGVREIEILSELEQPENSAERRATLGFELVTIHVKWGRFAEAWELVQDLKKSVPGSGEVLELEGRLLDWMGKAPEAEESFAAAVKLGHRPAEQLLINRIWARSLATSGTTEIVAGSLSRTINPDDPRCHLELAEQWKEEGLQGRALAVLEQAATRFPGDRSLRLALDRLRDYFGLSHEPETTAIPKLSA